MILFVELKPLLLCTLASIWRLSRRFVYFRAYFLAFALSLYCLPVSAFELEIELELDEPPIAVAGDDRVVSPGGSISFDGSASNNDATGAAIVSYEWSISGGVANADKTVFRDEARAYSRSLNLVAGDTAFPKLALPTLPAGVYQMEMTVRLVVTDEDGGVSPNSDSSNLLLTVSASTPAAPRNLTVQEDAGQLRASFDVPSDGGTPVTDIEYRLNDGGWVSTGSSALSFTIPGLSLSDVKTLAVRAVNAAGAGAASDGVLARFMTAAEALGELAPTLGAELEGRALEIARADVRLMSSLADAASDRLSAGLGPTGPEAGLLRFSSKCPDLPGFECPSGNSSPTAPVTIFSILGRGTRSGRWQGALHLAREFPRGGRERVGWVVQATRSEEGLSGVLYGTIFSRRALLGIYGFRALGAATQLGGLFAVGAAQADLAGTTSGGLSASGSLRSWNAIAHATARGAFQLDRYVLLPKVSLSAAVTETEDTTLSVSGNGRIPDLASLSLEAIEYAELDLSAELRKYFDGRASNYISISPGVQCEYLGDDNGADCFSVAELRWSASARAAPGSVTASVVREFGDVSRPSRLELRWDTQF